MTFVSLLFFLVASHCLFDYALQSEAMAVNKNPDAKTPLQKHVPWGYWLGSHALLHGSGVALVTGSILLGVLETICHFFIDLGKCKGYYTIHVDQSLHLFCKIAWIILIFFLK
jgi:Protein of unknown function (DUF3307)